MIKENPGYKKFEDNKVLYEEKIMDYIKDVFIPKFANHINEKDIKIEKKTFRRTIYFENQNYWIEFDFLLNKDEITIVSGYREFKMGKTNIHYPLVYFSTLEDSFEKLTIELTKLKLKKLFVNKIGF